MRQIVLGNFTNVAEADRMVNNLTGRGLPQESIALIANDETTEQLKDSNISGFEYDSSDEGLWEKMKDFFRSDDSHYTEIDLSSYREDIANDHVLLLVDEDKVPTDLQSILAPNAAVADTSGLDHMAEDPQAAYGAPAPAPVNTPSANAVAADDTVLELNEERLNVDKEAIEAGEVVISKNVVEQTQTIDVPVRHEELVVERVPVNDGRAVTHDFAEDTITIPLHEEQVTITKEAVVGEEVHVSKQDIERTQQVQETLKKETLNIDDKGNITTSEE